jgi:hypothetical protein
MGYKGPSNLTSHTMGIHCSGVRRLWTPSTNKVMQVKDDRYDNVALETETE